MDRISDIVIEPLSSSPYIQPSRINYKQVSDNLGYCQLSSWTSLNIDYIEIYRYCRYSVGILSAMSGKFQLEGQARKRDDIIEFPKQQLL